MATPDRVCVVGIDAADDRLVERWSAQGALPTLERLRRTGLWIPLTRAEAYPSASVWPTMVTGTHPGRHGVVHPLGIVPGTLALRTSVGEVFPEPPLWSRLAAAGLRSTVLDVPFAPVRGEGEVVHIADWGSYERTQAARSGPRSALADLVGHVGDYPVERDLSGDPPATEAERWRDHARLLAGVGVKGAALRRLAQQPWDFFIAVFTEAHAAGHHFWDLEAPRRHGREPQDPIRQIYRAIDAELARFLDVLDLTTTTLIVLSGHGMGPNVGGCHLVEPFLRSQSLLVAPPTAGSMLGRLRRVCPGWIRRAVSRRLPSTTRSALSEYWLQSGLDPRRSRAFALPSDQLGFIRINVAGREPEGPVRPGPEYAEVCRSLADSLRRLVDLETGRPVVRAVFHADETFPGPERPRLPDLLVSWNDEAPIEAVRTDDGSRIARRSPDRRSGNHRPDGFAIVCGAGLPPGRAASGHLLDVAPTVLASFGLEPASALPGRAWLPASRITRRSDNQPELYSPSATGGQR